MIIKKVVFKNYAPFTGCISEINNIQIANAADIDVVIPMYNSIEYSDNYSITSGSSGNNIMMNQLWPMLAHSKIPY